MRKNNIWAVITFRIMVENNPYDVMGCWVTRDTWLAGNMSTVSRDCDHHDMDILSVSDNQS